MPGRRSFRAWARMGMPKARLFPEPVPVATTKLSPRSGPQGLLLVDVGVEGGKVLEVFRVAPQERADLRGQEAFPDELVHAFAQAVAPFLGHEGSRQRRSSSSTPFRRKSAILGFLGSTKLSA